MTKSIFKGRGTGFHLLMKEVLENFQTCFKPPHPGSWVENSYRGTTVEEGRPARSQCSIQEEMNDSGVQMKDMQYARTHLEDRDIRTCSGLDLGHEKKDDTEAFSLSDTVGIGALYSDGED